MIEYYIWYQDVLRGVSYTNKRKILTKYKDPYDVFNAPISKLSQDFPKSVIDYYFRSESLKLAKEIEKESIDNGISFITYKDKLFDFKKFALVYYKGNLPKQGNTCVIGTRKNTVFGEYYCKLVVEDLVAKGVCINTTLGEGIDVISAKHTLLNSGEVFAFMPCGLNACYPKEQKYIFDEIVKNGGVLSPFPIGSSPLPHQFIMRNELMCDFSDSLIVIEAGVNSNCINVAKYANRNKTKVYTIDPKSDSSACAGNFKLLKSFAANYPLNAPQCNPKQNNPITFLLKIKPKSTDALRRESKIDSKDFESMLVELSMNKLIVYMGDGLWHYRGW